SIVMVVEGPIFPLNTVLSTIRCNSTSAVTRIGSPTPSSTWLWTIRMFPSIQANEPSITSKPVASAKTPRRVRLDDVRCDLLVTLDSPYQVCHQTTVGSLEFPFIFTQDDVVIQTCATVGIRPRHIQFNGSQLFEFRVKISRIKRAHAIRDVCLR